MRALALGFLAAAATFFVVAGADREPARSHPEAATTGLDVFARMGCGTCHTLAAANAEGQIGPDLDARLADHTTASLKAKILDPYPGGSSEGFGTMPEDFGQRLTGEELDALVAFLVGARR